MRPVIFSEFLARGCDTLNRARRDQRQWTIGVLKRASTCLRMELGEMKRKLQERSGLRGKRRTRFARTASKHRVTARQSVAQAQLRADKHVIAAVTAATEAVVAAVVAILAPDVV